MKIDNKDILVFFDIDNTIVDGYTQKYFIQFLMNKGKISKKYLLFLAIWFILYKLKVIKNTNRAIKFYVGLLNGLSEQELRNIVDDFFQSKIKNHIFLGALRDVKYHLKNGHNVVFVSMSLKPIVEKIAEYLKVNYVVATNLEILNGVYTGKILGYIIEGDFRLNAIKEYIKMFDSDKLITHFYTDHYSDIPILRLIDSPHVVNPDNILYREAIKNNWEILKYKK
ncbi:HAD-IB family hydrolase [Patescibacteria group bacterium]|nr:HAD-IB family hydrolase [Patescibacteria group bacterium]